MTSIWMLCQHLTHVYQSKRENVLYWLEKGSCLKIIDSQFFIDIIPPPEETFAQLRKQRLYVMAWLLSPHSSTGPIDLSENSDISESKDYRSSRAFKRWKTHFNLEPHTEAGPRKYKNTKTSCKKIDQEWKKWKYRTFEKELDSENM